MAKMKRLDIFAQKLCNEMCDFVRNKSEIVFITSIA